jgi:small-conductance mechanosensitive channel
MRRLLILCGLVLALAGNAAAQSAPGDGNSGAAAADKVSLPDPLTPQAIRDLLSAISDAQARKLLVEVLDGLAQKAAVPAPGEPARSGFAATIREGATGVVLSVRDTLARAPHLLAGLRKAGGNFVATHGWAKIGQTVGAVALAIAAGLAGEFLANRLAGNRRNRIDRSFVPTSLRGMLAALAERLFFDLGGLFVFFVVVRIVETQLIAPDMLSFSESFMFNLIVLPRLIAAFTGLLLSPGNAQWRLMNADDWTARFLVRQQIASVAFAGLATFLIGFQVANGVPLAETRLAAWATIVIFVWNAVVIVRAREGLRTMMAGWDKDITPAEAMVARFYPGAMLALLPAMFVLMEYLASVNRFDLLAGGQHYLTFFLISFAPAWDTAIRAIVRHMVPPMRGEGAAAQAAFRSSGRSWLRIGRVIVFGLIVLAIARIWNINLTNLAAAGVGAQFAGKLVEALVTLAAGYLVWEIAMSWIGRRLSNETIGERTAGEEDEGGGEAGSRLATVLPLLRLLLQAAIVVMTLLVALGQIGIDITPLLAGAGIVGLAIGFGAQTLVKDIVSGLFFLIDDAFRVGEYITVGGTEGTVEKISVRSLQLRHAEGLVHTIPYGEIAQVTNASRDWVIVKMKFTLPFDADLRKVKKIFKTIGADIMNESYAGDLLETFKMQGVGDVNDVGIVVRGKFTAKPGKQWLARKDIYSRIQRMFAENGIDFARREVRVNVSGGEGLGAAAREKVATAAAEAATAVAR